MLNWQKFRYSSNMKVYSTNKEVCYSSNTGNSQVCLNGKKGLLLLWQGSPLINQVKDKMHLDIQTWILYHHSQADNYKKKKGVRIEWRPVQRGTQEETTRVQAEDPPNQQTSNGEEGFTPVTKRAAAKQPAYPVCQATPLIGNSFQALELPANDAAEARGGVGLSNG